MKRPMIAVVGTVACAVAAGTVYMLVSRGRTGEATTLASRNHKALHSPGRETLIGIYDALETLRDTIPISTAQTQDNYSRAVAEVRTQIRSWTESKQDNDHRVYKKAVLSIFGEHEKLLSFLSANQASLVEAQRTAIIEGSVQRDMDNLAKAIEDPPRAERHLSQFRK